MCFPLSRPNPPVRRITLSDNGVAVWPNLVKKRRGHSVDLMWKSCIFVLHGLRSIILPSSNFLVCFGGISREFGRDMVRIFGDVVEPKYTWRDQTSLICRWNVPKRHDYVYRTQIRPNKHDIVAITSQWLDIAGYQDSRESVWLQLAICKWFGHSRMNNTLLLIVWFKKTSSENSNIVIVYLLSPSREGKTSTIWREQGFSSRIADSSDSAIIGRTKRSKCYDIIIAKSYMKSNLVEISTIRSVLVVQLFLLYSDFSYYFVHQHHSQHLSWRYYRKTDRVPLAEFSEMLKYLPLCRWNSSSLIPWQDPLNAERTM